MHRRASSATAPVPGGASGSPPHGGLILATLILGATIANLNMSVANVALPSKEKENELEAGYAAEDPAAAAPGA